MDMRVEREEMPERRPHGRYEEPERIGVPRAIAAVLAMLALFVAAVLLLALVVVPVAGAAGGCGGG